MQVLPSLIINVDFRFPYLLPCLVISIFALVATIVSCWLPVCFSPWCFLKFAHPQIWFCILGQISNFFLLLLLFFFNVKSNECYSFLVFQLSIDEYSDSASCHLLIHTQRHLYARNWHPHMSEKNFVDFSVSIFWCKMSLKMILLCLPWFSLLLR